MRWVRSLRIALGAVVGLALAYAIAINVFLSTPLFARVVNGKPQTLDVHYSRAWSIVPWRIHARNLSIRGRDSNVEWSLHIDEVRFAVTWSGLARQRFEASHVRGRGVTFRLRQRLDAPPTSPEDWAGLPPIEGLAPYGVRPPPEPSPEEWSDSAYNLWTVHLEDVLAEDTREVWIDRTRFAGGARVAGRFYLKPIRAVDVGPVEVTILHGSASADGAPVAEALDGTKLGVTVTRFDPRTTDGDLIHHVSGDVEARAQIPDVARLPLPLPSGVTLLGTAAVERAAVHVRSGVVQRESQVRLKARVDAHGRTHRVTAMTRLSADVDRDSAGKGDRLTFAAELADVAVYRRDSSHVSARPFLRAARVDVSGDSRDLDLGRPLADMHVAVDMEDSRLLIARALTHYIPPTAAIAVENGKATVQAHLDLWPGEQRASGHATLHAHDLDLRLAKLRVRGRTSLTARFDSYDSASRSLQRPALTVDVDDGTLSSHDAPAAVLVRIHGARLRASGALVGIDDPLRALEVSISIPEGRIVARRLLRAYLPKGEKWQVLAGGAHFALGAQLAMVEHLGRGTIDLRSVDLGLEWDRLRLAGGVHVQARVHGWRWQTGDLAVDDARVDIEHVTVASGDGGEPMLSLDRITLAAKSDAFTLTDPLVRVVLRASLVKARVRDPAALNAFLPDKATFAMEGQDAAFDADVHIDVRRHVATGEVLAKASGLGAGNSSLHLRGDVLLAAQVASWDFRANTLALLGARVRLEHITGRFGPRGPPGLSARGIGLLMRSPELCLERPTLTGADFHLTLEKGEIPDIRALGALLPPGAALGIDAGRARADADVWVSDSQRSAGGALLVTVAGGAMHLGETRLSGDFGIQAELGGFDPRRGSIALSAARFTVDHLAVGGATATTSGWHGDVDVEGGTLDLRPGIQFDGVVLVDARDARPLLALAFGRSIPRLVVGLTDMPRLVASSRVTMGMDRLALVDVDARGGDVALRGSYATRGTRREGGFVGRKWFVSAGFGVHDEGTWLRLFGLDGWLRDRRGAVMKLLEAE
jgi:hypothetical protein